MEGKLWKRSEKVFSTWQVRPCVLRNGCFQYYNDDHKKIKGNFNCRDITIKFFDSTSAEEGDTEDRGLSDDLGNNDRSQISENHKKWGFTLYIRSSLESPLEDRGRLLSSTKPPSSNHLAASVSSPEVFSGSGSPLPSLQLLPPPISPEGKKIHFCADSKEDQHRWLEAFQDVDGANVQVIVCNKKPVIDTALKKAARHLHMLPPISPQTEAVTSKARRDIYSKLTFPPTLVNGDVLSGIGPIVRQVRSKVGWIDERILTVAMYLEFGAAALNLVKTRETDATSLAGDPSFYQAFMEAQGRKTFVISCRKRASRHLIIALMMEEWGTRLMRFTTSSEDHARAQQHLWVLKSYVDKSLKKGESMLLTCYDDFTFGFWYKGMCYPPVTSPTLCRAVQGMFFDPESIQHEAKRELLRVGEGPLLEAPSQTQSHSQSCQSQSPERTERKRLSSSPQLEESAVEPDSADDSPAVEDYSSAWQSKVVPTCSLPRLKRLELGAIEGPIWVLQLPQRHTWKKRWGRLERTALTLYDMSSSGHLTLLEVIPMLGNLTLAPCRELEVTGAFVLRQGPYEWFFHSESYAKVEWYQVLATRLKTVTVTEETVMMWKEMRETKEGGQVQHYHTSLLAWLLADTRHQLIFCLMALSVYLASQIIT